MVTALKLAKRYNRVSISGQERGEREPPLLVILKYAQLVGISTDYLIDDKLTCRTNGQTPENMIRLTNSGASN
jgi:transcriptional regulator with XRE-family HTH domain